MWAMVWGESVLALNNSQTKNNSYKCLHSSPMFPSLLPPQLMTYMDVSVAAKVKAAQSQVLGRFTLNDDVLVLLIDVQT